MSKSLIGRASPTVPFPTSGQSSSGHGYPLLEDGVIAGETQMVPIPPDSMSSPAQAGTASSASVVHNSEHLSAGHTPNADTVGDIGARNNSRLKLFLRGPLSLDEKFDLASRRTDTFNVVICGETGSGKSSLVNLIAGTQTAPTSSDITGCTTATTVYEHDVVTQDETVKVQLFDTAGLGEDSEGTVPNKLAQNILKKHLKTLTKKGAIHLLMYCVQRTGDIGALQRNCKSLHSAVKGRVPIILVVTGLEGQQPEMEEWWTNNEKTISDLGMTFAGHACITALTINEDDTDELRQRREQSYRAVYDLIKRQYTQNGMGVPTGSEITPARKHKNIVLFGEAGAGKSSLVNLMAGSEIAVTSLSMQRCTLDWQEHAIEFDGKPYKVFDTIGLEESGLEMNEYLAAVANAYTFIKRLDAEGGVDLLLFCVRAGRFTAALQSNYRFFHDFLCQKKVPIVIAITNLEREQRMEDWWDREHAIFPRYEIHVAGHACLTAANGLDGRHQQLYEESRIAIRKLVKDNIAGEHRQVWTGGNNLFVSLVRGLKNLIVKNQRVRRMNITGQLTKSCGMSRETAVLLADMIAKGEVNETA
ncbi:P-loop containing nucleoside triphosphate hydrolase protein [Suillus clintonianus]|uniref:P-loop containing nucleoside triphosphate hydrolase protein n=1 Tax=Suillus clintonianus TaxID=1904413 RepID=UPI001B8804BD|nr:P-loop containing nucleoside triphosphate hydrolase protein [Suillus clintonianus]KAG2134457.1 P-loop containing nucleoside triphosphate hydrolase protein [Suillus clintonianus]